MEAQREAAIETLGADSPVIRALKQRDTPEYRSIPLPKMLRGSSYSPQHYTSITHTVGPNGGWTLDLRTSKANCGMWMARLYFTVPLGPIFGMRLASLSEASVVGARTQNKAIAAVVAAARIAGWIRRR